MQEQQAPLPDCPEPDPLLEAVARNAPLELHSLSLDRTIPAARARMLEIDDEAVYLEKPQIIGRNVRISVGQAFVGYFTFDDQIYTFPCTVMQSGRRVRLNSRKLVEGLVLSRPDKVDRGQRRQFYRTSLAAVQQPVRATFQEVRESLDEPAPVEHAPWKEATIVDASAGGFGVRVNESNYSQFKIYHNYFVRLTLPETTTELTTMCELRQVRPILDGQATRLGFLLLPWPSQSRLNWQLRPLLAYLTDLQRSRLAS
jgi:c-di-GMP-binding flagellar brake protein YcgR